MNEIDHELLWDCRVSRGQRIRAIALVRLTSGAADGALAMVASYVDGYEDEAIVFADARADLLAMALTAHATRGGVSRFVPGPADTGLLIAHSLADVAAFERGEWR